MSSSTAKTVPPRMSPSSSVRTRAYHADDLEPVHALFTAGFRYYARLPEFSFIPLENAVRVIKDSVNDDLSRIEEVYFGSGGHFWVATIEEDGNELVVGIIGLERKPNDEGELRRMSVHEDYRRYGIGRLLVSTVENWAKDNGIKKLQLSTGSLMTEANKFYQSIGYTITKRQVSALEPQMEAVFYEKVLEGASPIM